MTAWLGLASFGPRNGLAHLPRGYVNLNVDGSTSFEIGTLMPIAAVPSGQRDLTADDGRIGSKYSAPSASLSTTMLV